LFVSPLVDILLASHASAPVRHKRMTFVAAKVRNLFDIPITPPPPFLYKQAKNRNRPQEKHAIPEAFFGKLMAISFFLRIFAP